MVTLTHDAQSHLAHYLRQVRAALRGHRSVDPDDVERDVFGHIDAELVGRPEPIDEAELRRVLDRLGAPNQWAPVEGQSPWWAAVSRLRYGPEDWRLSYLALTLVSLGATLFLAGPGPLLWPLPVLLPIVAFFLARATLELLEHHDEPIGGRRWLIYPALLPWYIVVAALVLLWPLAPTVGALNDGAAIREWVERANPGPFLVLEPLIGVLVIGLWWTCLGLILRRAPDAVRVTFRPFGNGFARRHATRFALMGLLVAAAAGGILAAIFLT
jgi:hypothetical protein